MPDDAKQASEESLSEWIESLKADGIARLELRTAAGSGSLWKRPIAANSDARTLAQGVLARAKTHGQGMTCVRATFFVLAFDASGGESVDQFTLVVPGANAGKGESSEEGTAQERLTLHLLRSHAELHRLLITSQEGRTNGYERFISQLSASVDGHEKRRIAVLELYEKLVDGQAKRDQAERDHRLAEKRTDMIGAKIDLIAPIFVNRALGGGPGKGTPFMGEEMLKQLLANLNPKTIDTIMKGLPAEQAALFSELYMAYAKAHEEEEKRKVNEGANGHGGNGVPINQD